MTHHLSPRPHFLRTVTLAVFACIAIIIIISFLGKAANNLKGALTDKPDIAIYLLLPEEEIGKIEVLRESSFERDYLVETGEGPKFIKLKKNEGAWKVIQIEKLHE